MKKALASSNYLILIRCINVTSRQTARQHQECKTVFCDAQDDINGTQGQMKGTSSSQIQRCVKIYSILQALSLFSYGHVGMLLSLHMQMRADMSGQALKELYRHVDISHLMLDVSI